MNLEFTGLPLDAGGIKRLRDLVGSSDAADGLVEHVTALGGSYLIIERPYTDLDYSADYGGFYAAAFKSYPRTTTRLHFFKEDVSKLFKETVAKLSELLSACPSYLGFCVVRPISQGPIGRTVLPFPKFGGELVVRPSARAEFKVHLYGAPLEIVGAPFIQQERRVGACAQAAIWTANRVIHERHGRCAPHPMSDITKFATTPTDADLSRSLPAGAAGLSPMHITRALRAMGHQPCFDMFLKEKGFWKKKPSPSPSVIRYLDSGLPVILGLSGVGGSQEGHAVAAVGYVEARGAAVRSSDSYDAFVRAILVHDDQRGPYRLMPMTKDDIAHLPEAKLITVGKKILTVEEAVTHSFVPMSKRVFLNGNHADIVARDFIKEKAQKSASVARKSIDPDDKTSLGELDNFEDHAKSGRLIRRTYLTTAGRYRHHLARSDLLDDVKLEAIVRTLPHFIWVTELIYPDAEQVDGRPRDIVGHLVINATSSSDRDLELLMAHLPNMLFHRNVDPPEDSELPFEDSVIFFPGPVRYGQRLRN